MKSVISIVGSCALAALVAGDTIYVQNVSYDIAEAKLILS